MISLKQWLYGGLVGLVLNVGAQAATVSYVLNLNNSGLSGNDYGVVTLTDLTGGGVQFTVTPQNLTAGSNFGIQEFGFNSDLTLNQSNYTLPVGWNFGTSKQMDGYGSFDDITSGNGSNRLDPLTFSVNVGTIADYQIANTNGTNNGGSHNYFAAHIGGFNNGGVTSAYFASDVAPVPEPGSAAMMVVGLVALGFRQRKRREHLEGSDDQT